MRTIYADFNAMTEAEHLCLTTRGSQEDMRKFGIQIGDWIWLSDGELIVGAQVADDLCYGVVGIPDWETLVHLDDECNSDFGRVWTELQGLLSNKLRSTEQERRIFQLLVVLDLIAPSYVQDVLPMGEFPARRAGSLFRLGRLELALLEIEEARNKGIAMPSGDRLYLHLLGRLNLPRAIREAESLASAPGVSAIVLGECVNILAIHADGLPDAQFPTVGQRILDWCVLFDQAQGREDVLALTLAQLQFNRGLILLRLGDFEAARQALAMAHTTDPNIPEVGVTTRLDAADPLIRELAVRVRSRSAA
jgi:tetratricopeptide (TPR) repeat protein